MNHFSAWALLKMFGPSSQSGLKAVRGAAAVEERVIGDPGADAIVEGNREGLHGAEIIAVVKGTEMITEVKGIEMIAVVAAIVVGIEMIAEVVRVHVRLFSSRRTQTAKQACACRD